MTYHLCWLGPVAVDRLRVQCDIDRLLKLANQNDSDALANLVRLNWMVQDLKLHPMIKPIFARDQDLQVIVGDTRIMAARLIGLHSVPVMAWLDTPQGTVCGGLDDVKHLAGFGPECEILWRPHVDLMVEPPEWIDIGDHRTRHHGHDQAGRLQAMRDHLSRDPGPIDLTWVMRPRDWGDLFSVEPGAVDKAPI